MPHSVFVYGTLLRGMMRAMVLYQSTFLGLARTKAALYDLGSYPGMKEGSGTVFGELFEVDDTVLDFLDRVEGYDSYSHDYSLFVRKKIEIQKLSDGQKVQAQAYFYNHSPPPQSKISEGDFRRFRIEQESEQWILSFGSNISKKRLSQRVGTIKEVKKGKILDHRLLFNKKAHNKHASYANLEYAKGEHCPAIAWKMTSEQITALDRYEGTPLHYLRIGIPFQEEGGEEFITQAYIAAPEKLVQGIPPTDDYLECIRKGYQEFDLPLSYLEEARQRY